MAGGGNESRKRDPERGQARKPQALPDEWTFKLRVGMVPVGFDTSGPVRVIPSPDKVRNTTQLLMTKIRSS
jgi:hypothetical protein